MLAARLPATQEAATLETASARTGQQADALRRRIAQADTAISGLMTQLEQLGNCVYTHAFLT
jgi:phage shock protein A